MKPSQLPLADRLDLRLITATVSRLRDLSGLKIEKHIDKVTTFAARFPFLGRADGFMGFLVISETSA